MKTNKFSNAIKAFFNWVKSSNHIKLIIRMFAATLTFILFSEIIKVGVIQIIGQSIVMAAIAAIMLELNNKTQEYKFNYNNIIASLTGSVFSILIYLLLMILF